MDFAFRGDAVLLEVSHIGKSFGGLGALNDVSFQVSAGRIHGLIGPNGAGKTTLFNVVTGVSPASSGTVLFEGRDITRSRPHRITGYGISRTYQLVRPFYELTALENVKVGVLFGRAKGTGYNTDTDSEAFSFLEKANLADKADYLVAELNLGERKRLEIAKALAARPKLLLFDEVLAGLNPTETVQAVRLFQEINDGGTTILMIEHNMQAIMSACEHIFVLHHGELIGQGAPQEVARDTAVVDAYLGKRDLRLKRNRQQATHA
jgi:branched-chain amino acid transport system ATP-binding protein